MADLTYDSQDAVPEDLRESATQKDGKFVVAVAPASKVEEFRNTNIAAMRDRDAAQGLVAKIRTDFGYDPEKHDDFKTQLDEMRSTAQQVADGKLVKDTSLDEAVQTRTSEMQNQHRAQVESLTTKNNNLTTEAEGLRTELTNLRIDTRVAAAAGMETSGIRPDAITAVQQTARGIFKLQDNKLVPYDEEGKILYGADGVQPMTPLEWIKSHLSKTHPFFFKDSSGGGSGGSQTTNTNIPTTLSPAERMRLARTQG